MPPALLDLPQQDALLDWAANDTDAARRAYLAYRAVRVKVARVDVNEFIELVAVDEETGVAFQQSPVHEAMQAAVSSHDRCLVFAHVECGKSSQLSVYRVLWELGRNPNLRCAIFSETVSQSRKLAAQIKALIETSAALHEVFPHLRPGDRWTDTSFNVQRTIKSRDYSIRCLSLETKFLGSRFDLVVLDDILSHENTRTPEQRAGVERWYRANVVGRLTRNARVIAVGTPWHPEDLYHTFQRSERWVHKTFPVIDPRTGKLNWPERWPKQRIEEKVAELGPLEAARQLHCQARADDDARFRREWIEWCMERGEGRALPISLGSVPSGYFTVTGVDLGTRQHAKADLTVLFTLCVHPDRAREVLEVQAGRWSAPDIIKRIRDVHRRYQSTIFVESNAAQDFLRQFMATKASKIPVKPFETNTIKHHPVLGVEGLAIWLHDRRWIIPSVRQPDQSLRTEREIAAWIDEMLFYNPLNHTGDRLMASWIAHEGANRLVRKVGVFSSKLHNL